MTLIVNFSFVQFTSQEHACAYRKSPIGFVKVSYS